MKLIKKMLAIMFAFMMVVGMGTNVKAETTEGRQNDTTGTIIVSNPAEGHTYKLYKILNLESYSYDTKHPDEGNYSYTFAGDAWDTFVRNNAGEGKFFTITDNKYVTSNQGTSAEALAKAAIEFAEGKKLEIQAPSTTDSNGNLVFNDLDLGYYLVDSSVGALCGLDTTNPKVTIQEKNGTPTVEKKVKEDSTENFDSSNTADIGQTVEFKTTITAQAGAQNYVLHDKMDAGLTFTGNVSVSLKKNDSEQEQPLENNKDYVLKTSGLSETDTTCTFHIEFTKALCDSLNADDQIIVSYSATLNENAIVGNAGNKNETWLKYGNGTDTTHSTTTTKTFEIPVFKYAKKDNVKTGLAGAKFTLSKNANGSSPINLIEVSDATETPRLTYRVAKESETSVATDITTPSNGKFVIQGLDADTYYLTETEAPKGYNKLASPIKVEIKDNGTLKIDGQDIIDKVSITQVNVENKTGTLLPSTGGMGTTVIYMAGAILVIASGIVLVSKKRSKAK